MAALNSSNVTFPSLLASMWSNISSSFPGSVMSIVRQSSGNAYTNNKINQIIYVNLYSIVAMSSKSKIVFTR